MESGFHRPLTTMHIITHHNTTTIAAGASTATSWAYQRLTCHNETSWTTTSTSCAQVINPLEQSTEHAVTSKSVWWWYWWRWRWTKRWWWRWPSNYVLIVCLIVGDNSIHPSIAQKVKLSYLDEWMDGWMDGGKRETLRHTAAHEAYVHPLVCCRLS